MVLGSCCFQLYVKGTDHRDAFLSAVHFGCRPVIITASGSSGVGTLLLLSSECSGYCCGSLAGQACHPSFTHTRRTFTQCVQFYIHSEFNNKHATCNLCLLSSLVARSYQVCSSSATWSPIKIYMNFTFARH